MKRVALPISELSFSQKVDLMETLWESLVREENKLESPVWHTAVLKEREKAFESGKMIAADWEQTKKRIKKKVSCA